jgi:protein gp37
MAERSAIAWTDATFNPWMGCVKVSEGCRHCYAAALTKNRMGLDLWGARAPRQRTSAGYWRQPFAWARKAAAEGVRRRVFCGSLCDVFEPRRDLDPIRSDLFDLIRETPELDWLLLTKRPQAIAEALPPDWDEGWSHVWLGTTVEGPWALERAAALTAVPALTRFVSYEPALGPLDALPLGGLHWIIYGGESGSGFRGHDVAWARSMRDRCKAAGVAFFFKQSPGFRPGTGEELDGEIVREVPRVVV